MPTSEYIVMTAAERAAYEKAIAERRMNPGSSGQRSYILGYRDAAGRPPALMWPARSISVSWRLRMVGIERDEWAADLAVQSAREALHADEGAWFSPDTKHGWDVLEPHVYRFLDLTGLELEAVA